MRDQNCRHITDRNEGCNEILTELNDTLLAFSGFARTILTIERDNSLSQI